MLEPIVDSHYFLVIFIGALFNIVCFKPFCNTFLLLCVVVQMDHNTAKLKKEAEARLLHGMEEEERLYNEVQEKKRKYLLRERNKQTNEILDLQVSTRSHFGHTKVFLFLTKQAKQNV